MWSAFFTYLLVLFVAFENAKAQDYTKLYRRLAALKRPIIISADGSRKYYENPKRDVGHQMSYHETSSESRTHTQHQQKEVSDKVHIDVYYETDCPDSMRFITQQFYPVYNAVEEILDVNLYPYGKTYRHLDKEKKEYSFSCHHGPSECFGNTVQACALHMLSPRDAINFINCMESYPKPSQNAEKCSRKLNVDWDKINKCVEGDTGYELMVHLAEKTESLNPHLYFVPWIVFDGVFDENDFRQAQKDLRMVVCRKYAEKHPECAKKHGA